MMPTLGKNDHVKENQGGSEIRELNGKNQRHTRGRH